MAAAATGDGLRPVEIGTRYEQWATVPPASRPVTLAPMPVEQAHQEGPGNRESARLAPDGTAWLAIPLNRGDLKLADLDPSAWSR